MFGSQVNVAIIQLWKRPPGWVKAVSSRWRDSVRIWSYFGDFRPMRTPLVVLESAQWILSAVTRNAIDFYGVTYGDRIDLPRRLGIREYIKR